MNKILNRFYNVFYSFGSTLREIVKLQTENKRLLRLINTQHVLLAKHLLQENKLIESNLELLKETDKFQKYLIYLRRKKNEQN